MKIAVVTGNTDVDAAIARWAATAVPLIRGVLARYEASEA